MTAPKTIDGAMMNQAQIDALIARLRKLVPACGEWTTLAQSACGDAADALELLSASKPAEPEGWKMVPVEPTGAMTYVGQKHRYEPVWSIGAIYREMLAASPAVPAQSGEPIYQVLDLPGKWFDIRKQDFHNFAGQERRIVYAAPQPSQPAEAGETTYASSQATNCAKCGEHKHTPLRVDWMGGYVCLTCIDKELEALDPAMALDDERAAFEVWWNRDVPESSRSMIPYLMDRDASGKYANPRSEGAWGVWQAARAGLIGQHHRDSAELRRLCKARDNARVAFEARIAELESDRNSWRALAESAKRDLSTCAAFPQATKGDERSRFEQALRETYQMVRPAESAACR